MEVVPMYICASELQSSLEHAWQPCATGHLMRDDEMTAVNMNVYRVVLSGSTQLEMIEKAVS